MEKKIRRRKITKKMTNEECCQFNIEQREEYADDPLPYIHVKCAGTFLVDGRGYIPCDFHFVPLENAWDKICPKCKMMKSGMNRSCPFARHELEDSSFFTHGFDEGLPTDFNHANYTPVR